MQNSQGTEKKREDIESLPLDWWIKVYSEPNLHRIVQYSLRGKELPDDQQLRREFWVATGLTR